VGAEASLGVEGRRAQRKQREAQWAAFQAARPQEEQEHPEDVAAIAEAQRSIGDCKLKTGAEYVLHEVGGEGRGGPGQVASQVRWMGRFGG
jgi:hypothetical protein